MASSQVFTCPKCLPSQLTSSQIFLALIKSLWGHREFCLADLWPNHRLTAMFVIKELILVVLLIWHTPTHTQLKTLPVTAHWATVHCVQYMDVSSGCEPIQTETPSGGVGTEDDKFYCVSVFLSLSDQIKTQLLSTMTFSDVVTVKHVIGECKLYCKCKYCIGPMRQCFFSRYCVWKNVGWRR